MKKPHEEIFFSASGWWVSFFLLSFSFFKTENEKPRILNFQLLSRSKLGKEALFPSFLSLILTENEKVMFFICGFRSIRNGL